LRGNLKNVQINHILVQYMFWYLHEISVTKKSTTTVSLLKNQHLLRDHFKRHKRSVHSSSHWGEVSSNRISRNGIPLFRKNTLSFVHIFWVSNVFGNGAFQKRPQIFNAIHIGWYGMPIQEFRVTLSRDTVWTADFYVREHFPVGTWYPSSYHFQYLMKGTAWGLRICYPT